MPDPSEVLTRPAPPPTATLRYGPLPDHVADLWLRDPRADLPWLVVIHGGFWRARYDRTHVRPLCAALAGLGYPVVSIEYRRTGMPGGGWPGTGDDVRLALTELPRLLRPWLPASPDLPAALPVDLPIVLVGHSAGGQLALWAGSGRPLVGVVSLAGVCDLVRADELRLGAAGDRGAVDAFLGGSPAQVPEQYATADPMQLEAPTAPVILLHGRQDTVVPPELSRRYAARTPARLIELDGIEHYGLIDPLSPAWPHLVAALGTLTGR